MSEYINPYKLWHGAFVPNWLLELPGVSHGAKLVYARLCQYADKETGVAWPKLDTLCESVGIKERQCREYIKELEKLGLIESKQLGFGQSNQYRFVHTVHMDAPGTFPERQDTAGLERQDAAELDRRDSATLERQDPAGPVYKDRKDSIEKNQSMKPRPSDPSFEREWFDYGHEINLPNGEIESAWDHYTANGWKVGKAKNPMQDWKAALRTCKHLWEERKR